MNESQTKATKKKADLRAATERQLADAQAPRSGSSLHQALKDGVGALWDSDDTEHAARVLEAQALDVAQAGAHVGIWAGDRSRGDQLLACLRNHDHGGSDTEPGPDCRVWVSESLFVRHLSA